MQPTRALALLATAGATAVAACALVGTSEEEFSRGAGPGAAVDVEEVARRAIDAGDIRGYLGFLTSDAMRERETPSRELDRAASWIAERFRESGLEPAGDAGGYVQFWPHDPGEGRDTTAHVPNVVAVLPGADAARGGEHVVVMSHVDDPGGTAAVVEIAEAFGALPARPARPLLFLIVSGGAGQAAGAEWFAANPTVFLSEAIAVLNLERPSGTAGDTLAVIGHEYSGLGPLVTGVAADAAWLGVTAVPGASAGGGRFRRGEHYALAQRGIPAVALTAPAEAAGERPGAGEGAGEGAALDPQWIARVARLAFLALHRLADGDADAQWTERGREVVR